MGYASTLAPVYSIVNTCLRDTLENDHSIRRYNNGQACAIGLESSAEIPHVIASIPTGIAVEDLLPATVH